MSRSYNAQKKYIRKMYWSKNSSWGELWRDFTSNWATHGEQHAVMFARKHKNFFPALLKDLNRVTSRRIDSWTLEGKLKRANEKVRIFKQDLKDYKDGVM